jgi:hypothetical protein
VSTAVQEKRGMLEIVSYVVVGLVGIYLTVGIVALLARNPLRLIGALLLLVGVGVVMLALR